MYQLPVCTETKVNREEEQKQLYSKISVCRMRKGYLYHFTYIVLFSGPRIIRPFIFCSHYGKQGWHKISLRF